MFDELRGPVVVNHESAMLWSVLLAGPGVLIAGLVACLSVLLLEFMHPEAAAWVLGASTCPLIAALLAYRSAKCVQATQRYAGILAGLLGLAGAGPISKLAISLPPLANAIVSMAYLLLLAAIAAVAFARPKDE